MEAYKTDLRADTHVGPFLFVVNPNSGTGQVTRFLEFAGSSSLFKEHKVIVSKSGAHSIELAQTAHANGYKAVVAVGGDGSVHEIGTQLIHSPIALGIIPTGSGNGIARHFNISMDTEEACIQMLHGEISGIDTIRSNEHRAIGFCGIGIDAYVAKLFDKSAERGLNTYMKLSIDAFTQYRPTPIEIIVDGMTITEEAYTVVVANINQFGNNAFINPLAQPSDGVAEIIIVKKFPQLAFPEVASRLFLKNLHKSKHVRVLKAKSLQIKNIGLAPFQIDGEAIESEMTYTFDVEKHSLNFIIPKHG